MAGLRRIDGDELLDLLLAQWRCRGDGDHRFAHMTGELVDQPLNGLQITAVAQIAGRMLGQTLGHHIEVGIADQAVQQLDTGFAGTVASYSLLRTTGRLSSAECSWASSMETCRVAFVWSA